jgi:hypothetical protein
MRLVLFGALSMVIAPQAMADEVWDNAVVNCPGAFRDIKRVEWALQKDLGAMPSEEAVRARGQQQAELETLRRLCVKENDERLKRDREQAQQDAERARRRALPDPRLGMTAQQVREKTNMGAPLKVNRSVGP